MPIEYDNAGNLPPLKTPTPPLLSADALLAVDHVHLAAGDIPRGILRQFYEHALGLTFIPPDTPPNVDAFAAPPDVSFRHLRRLITLQRDRTQPHRLGLLLKNFDEVLLRLRGAQISCELLHADAGLTRTAILKDPAGNWIHLIETRDF